MHWQGGNFHYHLIFKESAECTTRSSNPESIWIFAKQMENCCQNGAECYNILFLQPIEKQTFTFQSSSFYTMIRFFFHLKKGGYDSCLMKLN